MDIASQPQPAPARATSLSPAAQRLIKLVVLVFVPLLMLGMLEGVAYLWERQQANGQYAWEMVASRRIRLVTYTSPGAGYTLMKPGSHYAWQGIPVDINSHGLRDPEVDYSKAAGVKRVLNLGDSVVMGWGVRAEDRFGPLLQEKLNSVQQGEKFESINAGVPGWNPENYLAYLQAEGLKYQPDIIILDLTVVNDIYGKSALQSQRSPMISWLYEHTYFFPFVSVERLWITARANGKQRISFIDPPKSASAYFPLNPKDEVYDRVWSQLEQMNDLAKAQGIPFAVVLFPLEFQTIDPGYSQVGQQALTQRALNDGIPVINLLPAFQQACMQKPGGPCTLEDHYLFADLWMHPSAAGHRLAAESIYQWIASLPGPALAQGEHGSFNP